MRKTLIFPALILLCAITAATAKEAGLIDGLWVMRQAEERYKGRDRTEQLTITVFREHRPDKKRVMAVQWFEKNYGRSEDKIVVRFTAPSDIYGTNLLLHTMPARDADRWLYFPADNIFRRIKARDRNSNFMGTDFTYEDLAERDPQKESHKLLRIEAYNGTPCYVVESVPKDLRDAAYSKTVTWVEKDHFIKLKIDYWDLGRRHLKTYTAEKVVEVDGARFPSRLVMRTDHSTQNTIVERASIRINVGLKNDLFLPHRLADFPYDKFISPPGQ